MIARALAPPESWDQVLGAVRVAGYAMKGKHLIRQNKLRCFKLSQQFDVAADGLGDGASLSLGGCIPQGEKDTGWGEQAGSHR